MLHLYRPERTQKHKEKTSSSMRYSDVKVSIVHRERKTHLSFSFSKECANDIFGEQKFGVLAIDERYPERIYFIGASAENGYKLIQLSKGGTRFGCAFNRILLDNSEDFVGRYITKYDVEAGAFYIDINYKF